jgi:hypothetical protein
VTRRKPATTNCSHVTKTRSPIMPPNSGSRPAAIPDERSGSRGRTFHSARPLVPARSCTAQAAMPPRYRGIADPSRALNQFPTAAPEPVGRYRRNPGAPTTRSWPTL